MSTLPVDIPRTHPDGRSLSPGGRSAGRAQIAVLLAGSCMPILGTVLLTAVVQNIQLAFPDDPAAPVLAPLVQASPALVVGLLSPFAGQIADRLGRKRLLLGAMLAYAVFGTAPLFLTDLRQILVSRLLVGAAEAAVMTACLTLIGDYFAGSRRTRILGLQTGVVAVAAIVFIALGGLLGTLGWRTPFLVYAVALVIVVPMALVLWEPDRGIVERRAGALRGMPWRALRVPVLVTLPGALMFYVLQVGLSYLVPGIQATVIGTVSSVGIAAAALAFGRLGTWGIRVLLPLAFALGGIGIGFAVLGSGPVVVGLGFLLNGLAGGLLLPTLLTWAVGSLPTEQRGRGTGLWTASFFLSQFVCGALVSASNTVPGGIPTVALAIAALSLVLAVATFVGTRRYSRPAPVGQEDGPALVPGH